eukprot:81955_1
MNNPNNNIMFQNQRPRSATHPTEQQTYPTFASGGAYTAGEQKQAAPPAFPYFIAPSQTEPPQTASHVQPTPTYFIASPQQPRQSYTQPCHSREQTRYSSYSRDSRSHLFYCLTTTTTTIIHSALSFS